MNGWYFSQLFGVSISMVVLYLNLSSLLPSCHHSTTMQRTSNGRVYTRTTVEDQGCSHHSKRTDDGYIRAHMTISRTILNGVLFPKQAWNMMATHGTGPCPILLFPCTILASISICWYLVLVITAQTAKTSGPHTNSSTAVAPLSVPLYSWRCQGRSMLHATHNCPGLEEIIDAGEEKAPGASFLL